MADQGTGHSTTEYPFLIGGGALGKRIAAHDWASTPLGPIEGWPQSLRTTIGLLLRSHVPMVSLWGTDGVMIYNDGYSIFAGSRDDSLLGSNVREGWEEIADFNDNVMKVGLSGGTLSYKDQELTLYRDGRPEQAWMDLDYSPVLDETGKPAGVIAIVVETTEKVLAQRWLNAEQERLRAMFEQAPGFIAIMAGPEHRIEFANPEYLDLVGNRPIVGKTVAESLPDAVEQGFHKVLDRVFTTGEPFRGVGVKYAMQVGPDAPVVERFIDFVYQPLRDRDGQVTGIFCDGIDVTENKRTEIALRESEARNRQILDSAIDYGIVATDLDGRVTRWNEGANQILGWTEADMLGRTLDDFFTPEDRSDGRPEVERRQAIEHGSARDERWHLRRSGERFWANGEMTPLRDEAGQAIGFVKVLRDQTAEHRAREDLRAAEQQSRRAQEAGGVGLFSIDIATDTIAVTPQFCRIFGIEPCGIVPSSDIERLIHPDDTMLISDNSRRSTATAELDVEYRIRRADTGEERLIARKAEYERDAAGKPIRLVGAVQDATERRKVQSALEKSEAGFSALAQSMPNQVWTARSDGYLDWFNAQVYTFSGATTGKLDGAAWTRIVHPDDLDVSAARWEASLASGETYETEFRLRGADDQYRWYLARAVPLRDARGAITSWVGTNTDIHAQKMAEVANARDRDRLWTMSQDLMMVCDFDGRITAVNPSASRLLGWSEEEMIGAALGDFIHADDVENTGREVAKLAAGATTLAFENRYRGKDGDYRLLDWTAVPDAGRIHAVGRDITEQRAIEDALRQSQKMEAVGQLTGGIAHDFNNLLQGITGSLDLLKHRLAQGRTDQLERFLTGAISSANRAAALTHRLLAFSRRQPLDPRPVRGNPLIASMEDMLRRTLGENVELEMVLAGGLWLTRCDPNQLESAILNLAINARDAMPDGGKLVIETCNTHLDSGYAARQRDVTPGQYICVCVTDTGIGMSADTMAKAFEPFFTTKPIGQGTGLGLSMIYGFARQSEGYARIYSELGKGTTMKLYLPRYRGPEDPEESLPALTESHAHDSGETVLVVEDEPVVRSLIVDVLGELGYRAIEAADGPKGLEILQSKRRIDLLITDIGLPGLNGRQVADGGRTSRPDLKVLFMTGYAENAALASGFLEPGMAMITKPFAMEALATRIRQIIEAPRST
jgi:PAS domain S-box-containing protein